MVNQKTLTDWILSNREKLDVRIKDCSWIRKNFPDWYDLDITISVLGVSLTGRGSDQSADTALSKAFCEAVERFVCHSYGIHSTGVAGHFDSELAKKNAYLEYCERLAVSEMVSRHVRPQSMPIDSKIWSHYKENGVSLMSYKMEVAELPVILCMASGAECLTPFGGILGLGAHSQVETAQRKALIECLRSVEAYLGEPAQALGLDEFKKVEVPSSHDRQALLRNQDYFEGFMESLTDEKPLVLSAPTGEFQKLEIKEETLSSCPLEFYRFASSSDKIKRMDFLG
jgi:ribosomal protein S12 methylthiotransferase accessory factor YcaO